MSGSETIAEILAMLQGGILFALILTAAVTDVTRQRIYNVPTVAAVLLGLMLSLARGGWAEGFSFSYTAPVSLLSSLAGAGAMFVLFFIAYLVGGIGAGDVKLMAGVGALTGLPFSLWAAFNTAIAGVPLALGLLIWRGQLQRGLGRTLRSVLRLRKTPAEGEAASAEEKQMMIPYAVAICLGVLWTVGMYLRHDRMPPFL